MFSFSFNIYYFSNLFFDPRIISLFKLFIVFLLNQCKILIQLIDQRLLPQHFQNRVQHHTQPIIPLVVRDSLPHIIDRVKLTLDRLYIVIIQPILVQEIQELALYQHMLLLYLLVEVDLAGPLR